MYRRLKNILGVSLMILAVVLAQIPMPEAQAEETSTVTFSMNGGEFNGEYNGYDFKGQTPVLVLDTNKTIDNYPDDQYASYAGYETEAGKWYMDKACIEEFDKESKISESVTVYKKWFRTEDGFCLNPDKTILYQYNGDAKLVQIPDSVKTIAPNAFGHLSNTRGIVLSNDIETIYDNAFSGVGKENNIIYIYDKESSQSKEMAQKLAESYEQFVYSSYLDVDKVEQIAGIDYDGIESQAEEGKSDKKVTKAAAAGQRETEAASEEQRETEAASEEQKTTEAADESQKETEKETETKTETETKPEETQNYTVTFDTGIAGIAGEKRTVPAHSTISELVSISGEQPQILVKGSYTVETDDGKQETAYTFDGWYKDSSCTAEWDFANDTIEGDTTVYAKWDRKIKPYFYVTFVAEGADNVPEKVKLYEDEPVTEPSKNPSIKGKTFKGWYTNEDGSGDEFVTWGKPLSGNLTLYAQWEAESYTVTFDMNGGKYSGTYSEEEYNNVSSVKAKVEKGKGIAKKAYPEYGDDAAFKYSGYKTDSNWYTDKNCLSKYNKTDSDGNTKEIKKNLTLYKKWYATTSGFTMNPKKTVLYEYSGSAENVKIPETVTVIGDDAFNNISTIKSIALPDALADVEEDAFSGFEKASKDVTLTAKSDSAVAVAKELASKYKHLVYDKDSASSDKDKTKAAQSDSVSVVKSNDSKSITLGATIGGNAGTGSTNINTNKNTAATSSTSVTLGASATSAVGVTTSGLGANSVTIGETPKAAPAASQAPATSQVPTASEAIAAQKPPTSGGSSNVSSAPKTKTTAKTNATAASAPSGARHVKDSTPKTGDPVQYRMLFVCVLFSAGVLLVLTGNGKRKKFSPS